jgi:hypothetical protein
MQAIMKKNIFYSYDLKRIRSIIPVKITKIFKDIGAMEGEKHI